MQAKPLYTIFVLLLIASFSFAWLPGWSYRAQVNISNSGSNLTDYQIPVNTTNLVYNNTGLVGSWHYSEASGTRAADSSGNANDGTLTNGPIWNASGKAGYAIQFDGINDYAVSPDTNSLDFGTGNFSIEAWVKPATGVTQAILNKGYVEYGGCWGPQIGVILYVDPSNKAVFTVENGPAVINRRLTGTSNINGTWNHIVAIRDPSNISLYVNGVLEATTAIPAWSVSNTLQLEIGIGHNPCSPYAFLAPFKGMIDEVRIYNRALSAQEIQARYNASRLKPDYSDLRFALSNDTALPYWLESDNKAWVKVPSIPNGTGTLYAYYGNLSAASASNGTNTFDFFDDFSGNSIDTGKWQRTSSGGTTSVSNSILEMWTGSTAYETWITYDKYPIGTIADIKMKVTTDSSTGAGAGVGDGTNDAQWMMWANKGWETYKSPGQSTAVRTADLSTYRAVSIRRASASQVDFYTDNAYDTQITANIPTTNLGGYLWVSSRTPTYPHLYVDWFFIRKYASPEPTTAEQQPDTTPPAVVIQSPNSTTYNTSTVNVNFTATDDTGISSCTVRLNGTVNSSTCSNYSLTLSNGVYTLNVSANDTNGNINSSQVLFNVSVVADAAPPAISIQSPANATYATGAIPVSFIASDDTAVSACTVRLNGTVNSTTCSNYSLTLGNGAYTLNVTANDTSGNLNSSAVSFTILLQQRVSNSTTTDSNGIGNASLNGIPPGAGQLTMTVGGQTKIKTMALSAGVTALKVSARVTSAGAPAQGKRLDFELY